MFVYNPLDRHSDLYACFASTRDRPADVEKDPQLLRRYRTHALRLHRSLGLGRVPDELTGDERPLVQRFRRFFPALLERTDLAPEMVASVAVVFPTLIVSDARADTVDGRPAVYVTSAKLDAIELFATTVSVCARLNELALPALNALEDRPPERVALAWLTMTGDNLPGRSVTELFGPARVRTVLRDTSDWVAPHLGQGVARYLLSHYLMQLMMRVVHRSARTGWDDAGRLLHEAPALPSTIDPEYLAVLTLSFVVLHEIGHHALRHNEIGFVGSDLEIALTEAAAEGFGSDGSSLLGSGSSFELAADAFAIQVVADDLREPLLEVATLWAAAHERAHKVTGDRFDDTRRLAENPDAHPSFGVRVWYLNGRFSTGARQGELARRITAQAEHAAAELEEAGADVEAEDALYQEVWELAARATDPDAVVVEPSPTGGDDDVLRTGLLAWEAGDVDRAESVFRTLVETGPPEIQAQATYLVGRMLELRDDAEGALVEYQKADALGDDDAPNDLGLLLQERGEAEAAIAAFRRADERGNAPAAYNLGVLLDERGDRVAALAAIERADARGHANAARLVGDWAYEQGDTDRAEAAWRRAERRDADHAATRLGSLLHQRGDERGAVAAWRRGMQRGEEASFHLLAAMMLRDGELDLAADVWAEVVARGGDAPAAQIGELRNRITQREAEEASGTAEAAFETGARMGRRGQLPEAIDALLAAERLGHPDAAGQIGTLLARAGDDDGAEEAYQRGAAADHPRAIFNLGVLRQQRGDLSGAEREYRRADALGDKLAATNLGSIHEQRGDRAAAKVFYGRGDSLGTVRLGLLLESDGDLDAAEAAYRRADEQESVYGADELGRLLHDRGDLAGAEEAWRRAELRGSESASYNLGLIFRRTGRADAAEAALRRAALMGVPAALPQLAFVLAGKGHHREANAAFLAPRGARSW